MGGRIPALSLSVFLLVGCGARTAGVVADGAIYAGQPHINAFLSNDGWRLAIDPTPFPETLPVGDRLLVHATPLLSNGTQCEQCVVRWYSSDRDIAYWTDPKIHCSKERCALLRALAPGCPILVVEVCPGEGPHKECFTFEIGQPEIYLGKTNGPSKS